MARHAPPPCCAMLPRERDRKTSRRHVNSRSLIDRGVNSRLKHCLAFGLKGGGVLIDNGMTMCCFCGFKGLDPVHVCLTPALIYPLFILDQSFHFIPVHSSWSIYERQIQAAHIALSYLRYCESQARESHETSIYQDGHIFSLSSAKTVQNFFLRGCFGLKWKVHSILMCVECYTFMFEEYLLYLCSACSRWHKKCEKNFCCIVFFFVFLFVACGV